MKADYTSKAKEAERKAKRFDNERDNILKNSPTHNYDDATLQQANEYQEKTANAYWDAAKNWMAAKNTRKAIKDFHLAGRIYGSLFKSKSTKPADRRKFEARCFQAIGYQERLEKVRAGRWHGLEGKIAAAIILIAGIFFLSPSLTGNVIGNVSTNSTNLAGTVLVLVGLVGLFFTFRK